MSQNPALHALKLRFKVSTEKLPPFSRWMMCKQPSGATFFSGLQHSVDKRLHESPSQHPDLLTHLCKVKVHETESEELEADREAVEQPEGKGPQGVGCDKILEVEGEEHGAQGRPQQAQGQERGLVAEALVSVPQDQPELDVDEDEEEGVEDGVDHRQAQSDVWRHGRSQGRQRQGLVHRLLLLHRGLHDLLSLAGGGGSGAVGLSRLSHPAGER